MSLEIIDRYLTRLETALLEHGITDSRILEEIREHLLDAFADGLRKGASASEAAADAVTRIGMVESVTTAIAQNTTSVHRGGVRRWLDGMWDRRWWIVVPTLFGIVGANIFSRDIGPRYRSEGRLIVVPTRVSSEYVRPSVTGHWDSRVQTLADQILSRTRLERIITDFNLYELERRTRPIDDVVVEMRRNISVTLLRAPEIRPGDAGGFRVSFMAADPGTAMRVTQRLVDLFVEMNLLDRQVQASGTVSFVTAQIADLRRQLLEYERVLEDLHRSSRGGPLSQADLIPYQVLQETYRTLLTKTQESMMAANLERRQIGEQFKVLDRPRLPERSIGRSAFVVSVVGGLTGLCVALLIATSVSRAAVARPRQSTTSVQQP